VANELRIGELSRRVGLKPELLRAWETRYGLLRPARTAGGLRLYSPADERRVRRMQERLAAGLSAAEAARAVLADEAAPSADTKPLDRDAQRLREALDRFDAEEANAALDRLLASFLLDTVLTEVVLPYLRELGERWDEGSATVTQEHFASNLLRARLAALARGWELGTGPLALLACAPGELHDLPLLMLGLTLRGRAWRVAYLGADTPGETLLDGARELEPRVVVVCAMLRSRFRSAQAALASIARQHLLAIAGPGASKSLADSLGAECLAEGPVDAADRIAAQAVA
jgi:MerR family transcriptional regulator, light-induced transcriptional regulator